MTGVNLSHQGAALSLFCVQHEILHKCKNNTCRYLKTKAIYAHQAATLVTRWRLRRCENSSEGLFDFIVHIIEYVAPLCSSEDVL